MKLQHFFSGGLAFFVGEMTEHFAGGMVFAFIIAGLTAILANFAINRVKSLL